VIVPPRPGFTGLCAMANFGRRVVWTCSRAGRQVAAKLAYVKG
jgi:hypothetical protein